MRTNKTVELGDMVQDVVSKFRGIAVARTLHLFKCDRITVEPEVKRDGTVPDSYTFDIQSLKIIKKRHVKVPETLPVEAKRAGASRTKVIK